MKGELSKCTAAMVEGDVATRILSLHTEVEKARSACVAWARQGIISLIAAGELLIGVRENLPHGDFLLWLDSLIESFPEETTFSRATAYNYMKATKYKAAICQADDLDFATVKELYIAANILPLPPTPESSPGSKPAPPFTISVKLDGTPPEQWPSMDRLEFMEKAKPVVDLYERVRAVQFA